MTWTGMLVGEGFEGAGASAAHVNAVLGDPTSPAAAAWVHALASPSAGHAPFMVVARPGLPVKPFTLFVPKSAVEPGSDHATVTWGAAQAGVAAGVVEAVRHGVVPREVAEEAYLVCAVWVAPEVTLAHADAVFLNNRAATFTALEQAGHRRPTVAELLADEEGVHNPFYRPSSSVGDATPPGGG